ncbi:MAG: hypothetical protein FJZ47_21240, partial [Candidatus Tectomicrobia bacterium]|nr:hypothetical protein [Candidatus Tectomicrobia bacterium]
TLVQIRDDVDDLNTYINLPWATRIALSQQFVEGMHILYSLRIVHADLNGQNLMVDMAQGSLTIIDLDGGAVAGTGQTPVVLGKPEPGWLAPEIMAELVRTTARQQVTVGIPVDLWSTACGVHYLLFGLAPFFFMAEQYQTAAYLQHHTWPALHGLNGIQTQNNHVFGYYERAYQQSPAQAQRLLTFAFQRGYLDTGQRPTAYQWLQELHAVAAQLPPAPRPPPPVPAPTPPPPVPARLTCTVCGEANTPDVVYCQHCLTRLGGERWCPHSPLPFAVPLRLLARFGKHRTPDRGRHCVVCGAAL